MFTNKLHEKAHNSLKKGAIDEAIALYTKALEMAPDNCDILSDRAVAYLHKKDKENCYKDFDKAAELQPDYPYRFSSRAFARSHFGDVEDAIADYEKAIALDPEDAVAYNNLGLLLEQQGYAKEAQERFKLADTLSKQEDHLYQMMEDLEESEAEPKEKPVSKDTEQTDKQDDTPAMESEGTPSKEFIKLFTSRKQFREFLSFVKNGFKIK